ncbi:MAG: peptide deformylase [Treponema sp.]|jgi:peptide deformylase|nr:peptide deformylase [Treponema sp.]
MKVIQLGDPILRQKAQPVAEITEELRSFIDEMFATMIEAEGVGLAAPQVGKSWRLFVLITEDNNRLVFINPQIVATSSELVAYEEGCLSIPKTYEKIMRPEKVTVQAQDEFGKKFLLEAEGLLARIIQHENDHLDGILYIDKGDADFKKKIEEQFAKRAERRELKNAQKKAKQAKIQAKIAKKEGNSLNA